MDKLIVGVDIGKNYHQATVIDSSGAILGGSIRFANTTSGAELLLLKIKSVNLSNLPVVIGLEATGHYWLSLYSFLLKQNFPVYVVNPYQSDAFRKIYLSSVKTDKEDSFLIADLIRFGSFHETKLADERLICLRNLTRFRVALMQQVTDTKRRIITILDQIFPEFASCFSDIFGKTGREILENYSTPESVDQISLTKLTNLVKRLSKGRFKKDKASEIKIKAANSFGVQFALDSFALELRLLLKQLQFVESQVKVVESEIEVLMVEINTPLISLPGVSTILAAAIVSEIGDIKRFKTSSQLVSFAGINPTVRQSGNFLGSRNHMSKKGSPYLRLALWQAAITSSRYNPILKEYYSQKIKEGKNHMTVVGAVSRRLTGIIFAMLRDNQQFQAKA